jgi:hypothetical protein
MAKLGPPTERLLLRDRDHLPSAVLSAVRAGAMALSGLSARRASDVLRRGQRVVSATLVALGMGRSSLRNRHLDVLLFFSSAA